MGRFKNKPQNRFRLVYLEDKGKPISYLHIESSEARTMFRMLDELQDDDWVMATKMARKMGLSRKGFTAVISRLAGVKYVDVKNNGSYHKVLEGPLVLIKKGKVNGKVLRGIVRGYRLPPIYIKKARKENT